MQYYYISFSHPFCKLQVKSLSRNVGEGELDWMERMEELKILLTVDAQEHPVFQKTAFVAEQIPKI